MLVAYVYNAFLYRRIYQRLATDLMDGSASQLCRTPHSLNLLLVMVKEDWTATYLVGIGYGIKNFTILG
jgi:hypothetical protein